MDCVCANRHLYAGGQEMVMSCPLVTGRKREEDGESVMGRLRGRRPDIQIDALAFRWRECRVMHLPSWGFWAWVRIVLAPLAIKLVLAFGQCKLE